MHASAAKQTAIGSVLLIRLTVTVSRCVVTLRAVLACRHVSCILLCSSLGCLVIHEYICWSMSSPPPHQHDHQHPLLRLTLFACVCYAPQQSVKLKFSPCRCDVIDGERQGHIRCKIKSLLSFAHLQLWSLKQIFHSWLFSCLYNRINIHNNEGSCA